MPQRASLANPPLLLLGIVGGLAAMWAGLARIGWQLPLTSANLILAHGPLMVSGLLGTLIGLERAVALGKPHWYLAPVLSGAATLLMIVIGSNPVSAILYAISAATLCLMFALMLRLHKGLFTYTLLAGAALWLVGNILWAAGQPIFRVVIWWMGFLVLSVAGERLELSRIINLPRTGVTLFVAAVAAYGIGIALTSLAPVAGMIVFGIGQLGLAVWLLAYDITRRTIRQNGMPRYIAICLTAGYVWMGISGILEIAFGRVTAGPAYDAILHTLFVGFLISMVFGHGPMIIPSILRRPFAYRPIFYIPLAILHLSLILRLVGDLASLPELRQWGGMINAVAVFLFAGCMIYGLRLGAKEQPPEIQPSSP